MKGIFARFPVENRPCDKGKGFCHSVWKMSLYLSDIQFLDHSVFTEL